MQGKVDNEGSSDGTKKKKQGRDAEKMAVELSKMIFSNTTSIFSNAASRTTRVDKSVVTFSNSARHIDRKCTWKENKSSPCYCKNADLKFEAHLPDRKYLTRYTVQCRECYGDVVCTTHLYCTYCDEVLTGSIAERGGKVRDHLITIRHVYQQALMAKRALEDRDARDQDFALARKYIKTLEQWSEKIRYQMRTSVKRIHFEEVLETLQRSMDRHEALPSQDDGVS
jgi:hypothetical protein